MSTFICWISRRLLRLMNRKPIFDAVRELLGRQFTLAEVDKLDAVIDVAEGSLPARRR